MAVGVHALDVINFPSATGTYSFNLAASIPNSSRLYVWIVNATSSRSFTQTAGPTVTAMSPASVEVPGHESFGFAGNVGSADSNATMTFTQSGGNLKCLIGYIIVTGQHGTLADNVIQATSTSTASTSHVTPSGTTSIAGCIEIQVVCDSVGTATNTSDWTPPSVITTHDEAFATGTTAFSSMAIGYNTTALSNGAAVGNDTWTADQSAKGSAWTLAIRPAAGVGQPPVANAGTDQESVEAGTVVTLNGTGTTDPDTAFASLTLTWAQISGSPTVTLTPGASGIATFTTPYLFNQSTLTFRLTATDPEGNSSTDDMNVVILPHNEWQRSGSVWVRRIMRHRTSGGTWV